MARQATNTAAQPLAMRGRASDSPSATARHSIDAYRTSLAMAYLQRLRKERQYWHRRRERARRLQTLQTVRNPAGEATASTNSNSRQHKELITRATRTTLCSAPAKRWLLKEPDRAVERDPATLLTAEASGLSLLTPSSTTTTSTKRSTLPQVSSLVRPRPTDVRVGSRASAVPTTRPITGVESAFASFAAHVDDDTSSDESSSDVADESPAISGSIRSVDDLYATSTSLNPLQLLPDIPVRRTRNPLKSKALTVPTGRHIISIEDAFARFSAHVNGSDTDSDVESDLEADGRTARHHHSMPLNLDHPQDRIMRNISGGALDAEDKDALTESSCKASEQDNGKVHESLMNLATKSELAMKQQARDDEIDSGEGLGLPGKVDTQEKALSLKDTIPITEDNEVAQQQQKPSDSELANLQEEPDNLAQVVDSDEATVQQDHDMSAEDNSMSSNPTPALGDHSTQAALDDKDGTATLDETTPHLVTPLEPSTIPDSQTSASPYTTASMPIEETDNTIDEVAEITVPLSQLTSDDDPEIYHTAVQLAADEHEVPQFSTPKACMIRTSTLPDSISSSHVPSQLSLDNDTAAEPDETLSFPEATEMQSMLATKGPCLAKHDQTEQEIFRDIQDVWDEVTSITRATSPLPFYDTVFNLDYPVPSQTPIICNMASDITIGGKKSLKRKRQAGVSTALFPPVAETKFGLLQEKLWEEPFWLLIGTTFLNKTSGRVAAPIFWALKDRYKTPQDLADAREEDLTEMIWHLGLQRQRAQRMLKMAQDWSANEPARGERYRTLGYPSKGDGKQYKGGQLIDEDAQGAAGALEIGHIRGCGAYAFDSWRIFCRDVLRGMAKDYNGLGAEDDFEPEWKRVRPDDKELRPYLRWMWLREGYIWDAETGLKRKTTDEEWIAAVKGQIEPADETEQKITDEICHEPKRRLRSSKMQE